MKSKWHFLITLIVVFVCAISLFPLISMIIMTTKTTEEIFAGFSNQINNFNIWMKIKCFNKNL